MAVDTSVIGKHTGAWRVVLDRAVLANFAKSVGDTSRVYQRDDAARAAGLDAVPAPPTFTFAAPYWARVPRRRAARRSRPPASATRCTRSWATCTRRARSCCTASRSSRTTARRWPATCSTVCRRSPTSTRRKPTTRDMTFVVMETLWTDAAPTGSKGRPVVTERFNLIARLEEVGNAHVGRLRGQGRDHHRRRPGHRPRVRRAVPRRRREGRGRRSRRRSAPRAR